MEVVLEELQQQSGLSGESAGLVSYFSIKARLSKRRIALMTGRVALEVSNHA